tara:strand:- start:2572 stop:3006 length:435 start_codon:yes stop_codon:yes gene_type:complete
MYNPPFTTKFDTMKTVSPYTNRDTDTNSALSKVSALNSHEDNVVHAMRGEVIQRPDKVKEGEEGVTAKVNVVQSVHQGPIGSPATTQSGHQGDPLGVWVAFIAIAIIAVIALVARAKMRKKAAAAPPIAAAAEPLPETSPRAAL